jgi:two-component system, LytTR family, sensor kinase
LVLNYQRILYWAFQLFGWFGVAFLLLLINRANNVEITVNSLFLLFYFALLGITLSHSLRGFFIRFRLLDGSPIRVFAAVTLSCLFTSFLFQALYDILFYLLLNKNGDFQWSKFFGQVVVMSSLFGTWSIIYFLNHFIRKTRIGELENLRLLAQKQTAELALMRSQLNPHFLFNSLNSIRALISENQDEAKNGISKLSNILRNILIYSRRESVSIEEEMQFVRDYLELEKIRFEERLNFETELDPSLHAFQIPPMTIQSLVENAVKHGIGRMRDGGSIQVHIKKEEKAVEILVINDGKLNFAGDTKIGLDNTISRLQAYFDNKISFELFEKNKKVIAKILIEI